MSSSHPTRRAVLAGAAALCATGLAVAIEPLRLARGISAWPWFSLTREFPAPRVDYGWPAFQEGRSVPRACDLARLRAAGLDFIRLPVDPGPFLAFEGARRAALVGDLTAAVEAILAAGLQALVNVQANGATHHYNPDALYGGRQAPLLAAYRGLVAELAGRLAAIDPGRIALEPVNEPPQACGSAEWVAMQMGLLGAARAAAPSLTLVATGACGGMARGLEALDPAPLRALGPILFTAHCYEPYLFSHQGAPWMREPVYRSLNGVPWPADAGSLDATLAAVRARMAADAGLSAQAKAEAYAITESKLAEYFAARPDRRFLARHLSGLRAWADRAGIAPGRVLIGEFGALRTDSRYLAAGASDRARYVRDMRESMEAEGFAWAFWNLFDGMGLMDEESRRLDPAIIAALGLRLP